jgi:hypothetical protein
MKRMDALDSKPRGGLRCVCIFVIFALYFAAHGARVTWAQSARAQPAPSNRAQVERTEERNRGEPTSETKAISKPLLLNLRLVWGADEVASYSGVIQTTASKFVCREQLGIDPYDPGFLKSAANQPCKFHDPMTRFGGCDIVVEGQPLDQITCQIQCTEKQTGKRFEKSFVWTLESLRDAIHVEEIGPGNCRISVSRVPGDAIRFATERTHLIYNAEEPLAFQLEPYALPWRQMQCSVEYTVVRLEDDAEMLRQTRPVFLDDFGNAEANHVLMTAPREPGVYELRCRIEPKRFLPNLLGKKTSIERTIQFVVQDNIRPTEDSNNENSSISNDNNGDGDDAPRERNNLTASNMLPTCWHPVWDTNVGKMTLQTLGDVVQNDGRIPKRFPILDAAKAFTKLSRDVQLVSSVSETTNDLEHADSLEKRFVIPSGTVGWTHLNGLSVGQMHRVQLTIDSRHPRLRVVIREDSPPLNATGGLARSGAWENALDEPIESSLESLLPSEDNREDNRGIQRGINREGSPATQVIELLFWPTSESATLSITNESIRQSANLVQCSVDRWSDQDARNLPRLKHPPEQGTGNLLEIHGSDLRSLFSSGRFARGPYDDWVQVLHFANSLAHYCVENRFETVAMVVDSEGGSLYPSQLNQGNRRNDTGAFSSSGRDPLQKDQIELLYRVLGQYRIGFIPMLELSGPIRDLEVAMEEMDLQDVMQGDNPSKNLATAEKQSYNPASARVQRALAACVEELHQRYQSHPNFQGLAIRLNSASHLSPCVPFEQANKAIKERFQADMLMKKSKMNMKETNQNSAIVHVDFQNWMMENSIRFVQRLSAKVEFISCSEQWMAMLSQERLSDPKLPIHSPVLLQSAADPFTSPKRIILQNWGTQSPSSSSFSLGESSQQLMRSTMALNDLCKDFEGQNAAAVPHRDGGRSISKVRVWQSTASHGDLLVSNAGSIDEVIQVEWDVTPESFEVVTEKGLDGTWILATDDRVQRSAETGDWVVKAPAGDAFRIRLASQHSSPSLATKTSHAKAVSWKSFDPMIRQSLNHALERFEKSLNRMNDPVRQEGLLRNSSFESKSSMIRGRLDGWATSLDSHATISIDQASAAAGECSLKIDSRKDSSSAWIQSDSFVLGASERLLIGLKIAANQFPAQATLSLSRMDSGGERFVLVASRDLRPVQGDSSNGTKWHSLQFDLTQELNTLTDNTQPQLFRIQIETKGVSQFWVDDLFVSTEFLTADERREMRSELFLAKASMTNGDTQPANQILTSSRVLLLPWEVDEPSAANPSTPSASDIYSGEQNSPRSNMAPSTSAQVPAKPSFGRRIRNLWGQRSEPEK